MFTKAYYNFPYTVVPSLILRSKFKSVNKTDIQLASFPGMRLIYGTLQYIYSILHVYSTWSPSNADTIGTTAACPICRGVCILETWQCVLVLLSTTNAHSRTLSCCRW